METTANIAPEHRWPSSLRHRILTTLMLRASDLAQKASTTLYVQLLRARASFGTTPVQRAHRLDKEMLSVNVLYQSRDILRYDGKPSQIFWNLNLFRVLFTRR